MKPKRLTLLSLTLLATLLIGALAINTIYAPTTKTMYYFWYPSSYSMAASPPEPWTAYIWYISGGSVSKINPSTILLQGLYSPVSTKLILWNLIMTVSFHGNDVAQALLTKLPHMGPGTFKVSLQITGKLTDGTSFQGSATISVTVPQAPPPP